MTSRLLIVSSRAPFSGNVSQVTNDNVCVVSYEYEKTTLQDILVLVKQRLGPQRVASLAFLLHCDNTQLFICFDNNKVLSLESVLHDSSVQQFLGELRNYLVGSNEGVHVFNSPTAVDHPALTAQLTHLMRCSVHLVKDLRRQQDITRLYFNVPQLNVLFHPPGPKVTSLDGYEKVRTVGKGAFGTAVLYRKLDSDRLVVIKEINMMELSATERQMALNEVQVLSSLYHPNIIRYLGSFEVDGMLMIEMEYADGGTLAQLISKTSRLSEQEVLSMFLQCVAAIKYMHQNNILHRDLKTANVFLTKDKMIKVGDFGISKMMSTKGQAQTVLGTPYYISPEMCEGKQYDHKSDVWALGCILYEMACLQKTFQGNNLPALVSKIMKGTFDPVPSVYSQGLRDLVTQLLQKDPTLRPTAADTYNHVNALLEQAEKNAAPLMPYKGLRSVLYQISGSGSSFSCVPVPLPYSLKIIQISVSNTHYIAVSSDMMVFTWGEGKRGQLGHPESPLWLSHPTPVRALADRKIHAVGAGDGFSVFLSDSGVLMTCGDGTFGCLGCGDWTSVSRPLLVEKLLDEEITQVACGMHHCVALTRTGELYSWGRGDSGRLGTGDEQDCCTPTKLNLKIRDAVKSVHCGPDCSAIITETGTVHACGRNTNNKLGFSYSILQIFGLKGKTVGKKTTMEEVKSLGSWHIVNISMTTDHTALLTNCGRIITMGSNAEMQKGHNSFVPNVVAAVEDKVATKVVCGPTYTVMSSIDNILYFWGTRYQNPNSSSRESTDTLTLLHTEVIVDPEEILALYASPTQIAKGEIITLNSVNALWDTILVLVDTTVPVQLAQPMETPREHNGTVDCDTIGPIPEWIAAELAQSEEQWDEQLYKS